MNLKLYLVFILCLSTTLFYSQDGSEKNVKYSKISVLFVGNSLTYTNDLPKLVENHAKTKGLRLKTDMVAFPNYALEDHWNDGNIQKSIAKNNYDFVIVQQGPSSQSDGRQMLFNYGKRIKDLCDQNGAKLCFLMVWPSMQYLPTFDGVIKNHTDAAISTNAILIPAGQRWKQHIDETDDYSFYGPDGFHPSLKGSTFTSEIIVEILLESM